MDVQPIISWMAPIASTVIVTAITAQINAKIDEDRSKTDAKRKAEAEWRDSMDARLSKLEDSLAKQNDSIDLVLKGQITQMRSDIVHKAHRYLDDLKCASTDEKNSFDAEYQEYCDLCATAKVKNEFVEHLHGQVMALPGREL